jgi:hypothetical protein
VIAEVIMGTASATLPVRAKSKPWSIIPNAFHNRALFSSAKVTSSSIIAFAVT